MFLSKTENSFSTVLWFKLNVPRVLSGTYSPLMITAIFIPISMYILEASGAHEICLVFVPLSDNIPVGYFIVVVAIVIFLFYGQGLIVAQARLQLAMIRIALTLWSPVNLRFARRMTTNTDFILYISHQDQWLSPSKVGSWDQPWANFPIPPTGQNHKMGDFIYKHVYKSETRQLRRVMKQWLQNVSGNRWLWGYWFTVHSMVTGVGQSLGYEKQKQVLW